MSKVIDAVFTAENLKYMVSLIIGGILSFTTLWHTVNKNAFELKSQNERILNNVKMHDETKLELKEIKKEIEKANIMLARIEERI